IAPRFERDVLAAGHREQLPLLACREADGLAAVQTADVHLADDIARPRGVRNRLVLRRRHPLVEDITGLAGYGRRGRGVIGFVRAEAPANVAVRMVADTAARADREQQNTGEQCPGHRESPWWAWRAGSHK